MNKFQALVEIVKSTPPEHRSRTAFFAIVAVALPATATVAGVVTALLR